MTPQRLAACSAACGLIVGIGIGFRQDVLMCAPAFLAVAAMFLPGTLRETWRRRIASAAIFAACVTASGGPILYVLFAKGNNSSHDTLIGTVKYCDQRLGVGSPVYDLGDPFLDEYTRAVVESYNYRVNGDPQPLRHYTATYDHAASAYFLELAKTFPADFAIRAYASVLRILDEVRPDPSAPWPPGTTHPTLKEAYRLYEHATRLLLTHGRYCALLALLLLAARSPRMAFCALFLVGWLAGYPALRFSIRHCFHLQLIPFWMAGFLIQRAFDAFSAVRSGEYRREGVIREYAVSARSAGMCLIIAAAVIMTPLWTLRAYQQRTATTLFRAYETASTEPVNVSHALLPDDSRLFSAPVVFSPHAVPAATRPPVKTEHWVIELNAPPGQCIPLTLKYEAYNTLWDFTRVFNVCPPPNAPEAPTKVYLPIYTAPTFRFRGIQLAAKDTALVKGIRRLTGPNSPSILIPAALYPSWQDMPLHYTLTR